MLGLFQNLYNRSRIKFGMTLMFHDKVRYSWYSMAMLEEIKLPVEQLREEIMNVWGRL